MPQIIQQGSVNTTALIVPDLYVQIVPPATLALNGVPSNVVGVVGTAQWGPVNQPAIVGSMAQYASAFGSVMNRKYDMGTQIATAVLQGASNFKCVRVTDGTDTAASIVVETTCLTLTAIYTGTLGNIIQAAIGPGSAAASFRVTLAMPGQPAEIFDNIGPGLTGNALWLAVAAAINSGNNVLRGPSHLVTATAGVGTTAPTTGTVVYTLAGGTDGVATITSAVLIGVDTLPRKGMYALRGQGCSVALLSDCDDSTQWTTQAAFGLSEGIYMIVVAPAGSAIANGTTGTVDLIASTGIDSYAVKVMHGDWIFWNDPVNQVLRLVSPQGFAAGLLGNLSPQNSTLNKQIFGVVGSQKSGIPGTPQATTYSGADLQALISGRADVICRPQPGGSYWGCRSGSNSSSNAAVNGDNYTRMTNYIAATVAGGMGLYVGQVVNIALLNNIRATLMNFFSNLVQQGLLANSVDGSSPFGVACDASNNQQTRIGLGYVQADCQVQYQAINKFFIVNLQGGQTVQVTQQATTQGATPATPAF